MKVGDESMSAISFLDNSKRELTSLVLCFPQEKYTRERVQDSNLFYHRGLDIDLIIEREGMDEAQQV